MSGRSLELIEAIHGFIPTWIMSSAFPWRGGSKSLYDHPEI